VCLDVVFIAIFQLEKELGVQEGKYFHIICRFVLRQSLIRFIENGSP
jgi:hypothetical protein